MPFLGPLVLLALLNLAEPTQPGGGGPRFAVGETLGLSDIAGASGEREGAASWAFGATANYRILRFVAIGIRYTHAEVDHDYGQTKSRSGYHRAALMLEGSYPLGTHVDVLAWLAPETLWLRSSLSAAGVPTRNTGRL